MKPPPFRYLDPETVRETLDLLEQLGDEAVLLAGGQSLIPLLNMRLATPSALIDLRKVGLAGVQRSGQELRVGAMTRAYELERDPAVRAALPFMVDALKQVGHPQIRNRTTIGGNVAHADPASEIPAILVALDGSIRLASASAGERVVPASEFFLGAFYTARRPNEVVTEVSFPIYPGRGTFLEVARRRGDFALVGACVAAAVVDGTVADVRIAVCGAGERPVRVSEAEALLTQGMATQQAVAQAGRVAAASVQPTGDAHGTAEYRAALTGVLVERGLVQLLVDA